MAEQTLLEKALAAKRPTHASQQPEGFHERLDLALAFAEGKIASSAGALVTGTTVSNFTALAASAILQAIKRGLLEVRRIP